ncbi:hypothetical protein F503_03592 [Ophiostoma piceae UAMH 11346]|uniref:Uncharacterized protein n=1 Tax=Ophiostoma piceae (strain UAMH 11346) TaxID=1262450 RepID=S3CUW3_OPHP1|nr:hypothetical protein F503_03592 [Ophiostoma piceae UAMH 11346]
MCLEAKTQTISKIHLEDCQNDGLLDCYCWTKLASWPTGRLAERQSSGISAQVLVPACETTLQTVQRLWTETRKLHHEPLYYNGGCAGMLSLPELPRSPPSSSLSGLSTCTLACFASSLLSSVLLSSSYSQPATHNSSLRTPYSVLRPACASGSSCGHEMHIASSWCNTYRRTQKVCPVEVAYYEWYMDQWCSRCRCHTSDNQRIYLRQIYEDLKKRHPERNWDHIGLRAEQPDRNFTPTPWQREDGWGQ